jgi:hypothetical protein
MGTRRTLLSLLVIALLGMVPMVANADTVHLKTGRVLEGVVLKETGREVILRLKYTTATIDRSEIKSIERTPQNSEVSDSSRIPGWDRCLKAAVGQAWVTDLRPIPATVIDNGVMCDVPYKSFRSGDYEFNIYGDPEHPAGLEVGVYGELVTNGAAKANCVRLMNAWLPTPDDRSAVNSLRLTKDAKSVGQLTFEVTPPTDPDAYGGWWVSVYDKAALDSARASGPELKAITTRLPKSSRVPASVNSDTSAMTAQTSHDDGTSPMNSAPAAVYDTTGQTSYDPSTYRYARSPGKDVYVRSYYRKDGSYVHAHTRSAPGGRR